ncbi:MAG: ATPase, T2SS/T4P/T4SS family [Colwellia sp.]
MNLDYATVIRPDHLPADLDAYIVSEAGKEVLAISSEVKKNAPYGTRQWLRNQVGSGVNVKQFGVEVFDIISSKYKSSSEVTSQNVKTVIVKKALIELPSDLDLPQDSSAIYGLNERLPSESQDLFAFIRPTAKSTVGYLYFAESVVTDADQKQAYKTAKSLLSNEDWCHNIKKQKASIAVIQYLLSIDQNRGKMDESEVFSESKTDVYALIRRAVELRASDIHIYYMENGPGDIVLRIDKEMRHFTAMPEQTLSAMCRQMFNNMKNNQSKKPWASGLIQEADISITVNIDGNDDDHTLRWQSSPQDGGSKIVLRILKNDHSSISGLEYEQLGYTDKHAYLLRRALSTKKGLIITVGVTGSGKSTTNMKILLDMYEMNPTWNFDTTEDPIEYRFNGIAQRSIDASVVDDEKASDEEKRKMAFNLYLKALMRQDPDVIMLGEIRDNVTAELVRDFVNTGHKIITTLHADSALYTYERLGDIGIDKETLCRPGFFNIITCQMLLPKLCKHCSLGIKDIKSSSDYKFLKYGFGKYASRIKIRNTEGCTHCNAGTKGMTVCAEMLMPDSRLNQYIRNSDFVGAENYWANEMSLPCETAFNGNTMLDHFVWKVAHGEVCPIQNCSEFDSLEFLFAETSYERLLSPIQLMKSVV